MAARPQGEAEVSDEGEGARVTMMTKDQADKAIDAFGPPIEHETIVQEANDLPLGAKAARPWTA